MDLRGVVAARTAAKPGAFSGRPDLTVAHSLRSGVVVAGWLCLNALFNLLTLLSFPPPFVDEAWGANRAWAMLQTGRAFGTMDEGVFQRYPGYWNYMPWLGTAIHAVVLRAFGLSLFSMRLTSVGFGVLLLISVYVIGRQLLGEKVGLLAVVLVSLSLSFRQASHLGRDDVVVAAFGFGALALYLTDESTGFSARSLLSGLLIGLTLDIHFNGLVFGPAVGALYLYDQRWRLPLVRRFWGFAAGVAAGIGFFVSRHILPDPNTYAELAKPFLGDWREPPILVLDPRVWFQSVADLYTMVMVLSDFKIVLVIAAVVVFLRQASNGEKRLLTLLGGLAFGFAAVIRYKELEYGILLSPAVDLLVAAFLWRELFSSPNRSGRVKAGLVLAPVALSLAFSGLATLVDLRSSNISDYQSALHAVQASVTPGATVMGPQTYWFGITDHRYLSWEQLVYYEDFTPGSTLSDAFRALHPDYFIRDDHQGMFVADTPIDLPSFQRFLFLSRPELDRFLDAHAQLVRDVKTRAYGDVRIYRIDWGE